MSRILRGTDLEVAALHEVMGFNRGRDKKELEKGGKGGRKKKEEEEEEEQEKVDLLAMEDQVAGALAAAGRVGGVVGGKEKILVTSVDTARGLDFGSRCDCVIVLGRARTPDEYQHVAGRTGRGGGGGGGGEGCGGFDH